MSTEGLIRKGLLAGKKHSLMKAVIDGKAALQALLNEAMYAKGKAVEDINVDSLQSHLDHLWARKEECVKLIQEIKDLE